jgi:hypothetical protein
MTHYIGLDVLQKLTSICIVDDAGRRLWRGQCASDPEQMSGRYGLMPERMLVSASRPVP